MKKVISYILLVLVSGVVVYGQDDGEATPEATEVIESIATEPSYSVEGDGVVLDVYFTTLRQGRAALLGLRGDDIISASANIFLGDVEFFQVPERDGWWALFSADIGQTIRRYDLTVTVDTAGSDDAQVLLTRFDVITGGFISQPVTLVPDEELERLLDPEVQQAELDLIFSIASEVSEEAYWDEAGFETPLFAELSSPFGAERIFNDEFLTMHTGWDFNAPTGVPLLASADGVVTFAGGLDIRGNYVLVDHGRGVYSGYAHMSVIYVTQGQSVSAGQVLGLVGSTGRSSSAHAHFEMIVDGNWVDPIDFLRMYVP